MATREALATLDRADAAIARLRCWGDFAISELATGTDLKPRGRKTRALLAYLAMHPGKPIGRERLAGLFWGERGDEQARLSLRQAIFELKPLTTGERPLLRVGRETLSLHSTALMTDIDELKALAARRDFDALLLVLPEPDEMLFANLDGLDAGFDDWLAIERARQLDALTNLVGEASASAARNGQLRAARALRLRLNEFGAESGGEPAIPAADPVRLPDRDGVVLPARQRAFGGPVAAAALLLTAAAGLIGYQALRAPVAGQAVLAQTGRSEAATLYRTARSLIYKRDPEALKTAAELLRRAVVLDPASAPAISSLASVTAMLARDDAGLAEAERYARRAVALGPQLAQSHGTLGMVLGFKGSEALRHLAQAARLDPHDAEIQFWLSNAYVDDLQFEQQLSALRRAVAIDPQWPRAVNQAALAAWALGHSAEADNYVRRLTASDPEAAFLCEFELDVARGEFASIVRTILPARVTLERAEGDHKLGFALLVLGHMVPARLLLRLRHEDWAMVLGAPPTADHARRLFAARMRDQLESRLMITARRELLNAGRAAEVVALYAGSSELSPAADPAGFLEVAPDMALALRAVGKRGEAEAVLGKADDQAGRALAAGNVPNWFSAQLAQLRGAQGREDEAIAALGTAIARGWHFTPLRARPDIGTLPAFRGLRGHPAFERLRSLSLNQLDRERRKLGAVQL